MQTPSGYFFKALIITTCWTLGFCRAQPLPAQELEKRFEYAIAAVDNPLKGLVPYHGQGGKMPHSMEFWYFPMAELIPGPSTFDWTAVETKLESARQRGNQMILRVYLEYPNQPSGVPTYLLKDGLRLFKYRHDDDRCETPDYSNPKLINAIIQFVEAFGKKYDGDPRIGFLTMGIIGQWGEWHTYPRNDLFPSKKTQTKIMQAFERSFKKTKVLMRYPAGDNDWQKAKNSHFPFGYHDDSFAWATLDTGRDEDDWFYMALLKNAGKQAEEKWKTEPIGGEIRPEIWGCVFDEPGCAKDGQTLDRCIQGTHVTWLMDTSFPPYKPHPNDAKRIEVAKRHVQSMGYELSLESAKLHWNGKTSMAEIELVIRNNGIAPFYYPWLVELQFSDENESPASEKKSPTKIDLTQILPGESRVFKVLLAKENSWIDANQSLTKNISLKVNNPMQGGKPFRFANKNQNEDGVLPLFSAGEKLRSR